MLLSSRPGAKKSFIFDGSLVIWSPVLTLIIAKIGGVWRAATRCTKVVRWFSKQIQKAETILFRYKTFRLKLKCFLLGVKRLWKIIFLHEKPLCWWRHNHIIMHAKHFLGSATTRSKRLSSKPEVKNCCSFYGSLAIWSPVLVPKASSIYIYIYLYICIYIYI